MAMVGLALERRLRRALSSADSARGRWLRLGGLPEALERCDLDDLLPKLNPRLCSLEGIFLFIYLGDEKEPVVLVGDSFTSRVFDNNMLKIADIV